jgi:hypothetical protein
MAKATIHPGVCGFTTVVEVTQLDMRQCKVSIQSTCQHIQKLAAELETVDPFKEISFRGQGPSILKLGTQYCAHPACPVPAGIIKAVEVEAGLALPQDVHIQLEK